MRRDPRIQGAAIVSLVVIGVLAVLLTKDDPQEKAPSMRRTPMRRGPWIQGGIIVSLVVIGVLVLTLEDTHPGAKAPFFALLAAGILLTAYVRFRWRDMPPILAALSAAVSAWYWIAHEANGSTAVPSAIVLLALPTLAGGGFLGGLAFNCYRSFRGRKSRGR